ncbi:peptidase inhibitor family I36 protein [Streptomyces zhihengii]|uniref:peptidase inhibitor family I36 protein n=1 Tax=Streptomyces zhihengii TaxID=1818004 RepID=UPI0033A9F3C0
MLLPARVVQGHFGGGCATTVNLYNNGSMISPEWNDSISSLRNHSGGNLCFYEHAGFAGDVINVGNGASVANLHTYSMGDKITSWRPC